MRVREILFYVGVLPIAMVQNVGCRNTKTFQNSVSIEKEKKKQTILAGYRVSNDANLKLMIGAVWVEEIRYYDDTCVFVNQKICKKGSFSYYYNLRILL